VTETFLQGRLADVIPQATEHREGHPEAVELKIVSPLSGIGGAAKPDNQGAVEG